jgi:AcrR family transcriptional regulator
MNTTKSAANKKHTERSGREAILDAAERLFAENGMAGVSMRNLTKLAGTNLASVNYHFGSKENLFTEVIARRIRPINARRLELLAVAMEQGGESGPSLKQVLDAFVRPMFEMGATTEQREHLRLLITRVFTEADSVSMPIFETELLPVGQQFGKAISLARPNLEYKQIAMGMFFFVGATINLFVSMRRFARLGAVMGGVPENEEMLEMLVKSGVAIFDSLGAEGAVE